MVRASLLRRARCVAFFVSCSALGGLASTSVAAAQASDGLDSAQPVPAYGTRGAVQQSEATAMRDLARRPDSEADLASELTIAATIGAAMGCSYSDLLQEHMFGPSSPVVAFDATLTHRVLPWLALGGRIGSRGLGWVQTDADYALAAGVDALGIAEAILALGSVFDVRVTLGAGLGGGGVSLRGATNLGVSPRLHGAVGLGVRIDRGMRFAIRGAWDYFSIDDLNQLGSDVDLGGPSASASFEVRL